MQVTVEEKGVYDRQLHIRIPATRVDELFEQEYARLANTVRLPGFRPGKVPRRVLEQRFHDSVLVEVMEQLVSRGYQDALVKEQIRPVGDPALELGQLARGNEFAFSATIQVFPQLDPQGYKGIPLTRATAPVAEEDVTKVLDRIQVVHATYTPAEGATAQDGDRVVLDFKGFLDGQPFEGGEAEQYHLELGSGRFIPGFEEQLVGAKAGEERTVNVTFPDTYQATELAGKEASFQCTIHEVRQRELPPLDDALAEKAGIREGGLAVLREEIVQRLEKEAETAARRQLRQQVLKQLLEANRIELPSQLIAEEVGAMVAHARNDIQSRGGDPDRDGFDEAAARAEYEPMAHERVILGLTIGAVAKAEGIAVTQEDLHAHVTSLAEQYQTDPAALRQWLKENPDKEDDLRGTVLEGKVLDWIIRNGEVTEEATTLETLLGG